MTIAQAEKAKAIIQAKGRTVTFIKLDRGDDDTDKPWRGKNDPRATPAASLDVPIVAVPPSGVTSLGLSVASTELVKRSEQILIAAPGNSAEDLLSYDEVLDGSKTWKINGGETLQHDDGPAVLYYVGVRR